jgi:hypothetical protein
MEALLVEEIRGLKDVRSHRIRDHEVLAIESFVNALPGYLLPDAAGQARISTALE